jgi:RNA polymerase sigma-70 factor (ECF subfamily)
VAGRRARDRALRGPLLVQDLAAADRRQSRDDLRREGGAKRTGRGEPGAGAWSTPPEPWPEDQLLAGETRAVIDGAIEELPPLQRAVVSMRDIEGLSSEEVQEMLDISAGNQRVLLHRGRQKVREALNAYLSPTQ